jgi:hypothetical protein
MGLEVLWNMNRNKPRRQDGIGLRVRKESRSLPMKKDTFLGSNTIPS